MRTALAYASLFGVVASAVASRPAPVRDAWLAWASTDLVNLADRPLGSLVASAFVSEGDVLALTALALIGLGAAGEALGDLRLAGLLAATHVLGTLVSQSVLGLRIHLGDAPESARSMLDVGASYVVAPALVLGILLGSTRGRIASGVGFAALAPHLFGGLTRLDVPAVGHVVAIATALLAGPALQRDRSRRRALVTVERQHVGR